MKKIVILSTQRSGSTVVCDDVEGTGKLGRPSEYFIKVIDALEKGPEDLESLIREAVGKGKTENGITSIKVMANQIFPIGRALPKSKICNNKDNKECFYELFKDAVFARVIRQDKLAQAVSRSWQHAGMRPGGDAAG